MADKLLQAVYGSAADDVVFVRKFPPDAAHPAPSYFGGLPRLPSELSWPYSRYIGQHISFLAQIDLGSLPNIRDPWLPDETWPYAWVFVEIFCTRLLDNSHRYLTHPEPLEEEARQWRGKAQAAGLFSPMSAQLRAEFRTWIRSIPLADRSNPKGERLPPLYEYNWITDSLIYGADACLGYAHPGLRLLPDHLLRLIEGRHRAFTGDDQSFHFVRHQVLGAPRAVQSAADEFGASHVLLAQFDYDPGCLWKWGDTGTLQFWIKPEYLKVCRFDQAIMTMEGG